METRYYRLRVFKTNRILQYGIHARRLDSRMTGVVAIKQLITRVAICRHIVYPLYAIKLY